MNQSDQKPSLDQKQKNNMLEELESLSQMLDQDSWEEDAEDPRPVPEDIPVLKSFVESVPTLNTQPTQEASPSATTPSEMPLKNTQINDSLDQESASYHVVPVTDDGKLDMSFLDQDPLHISERVRQQSSKSSPTPARTPSAASAPQSRTPSTQDRQPITPTPPDSPQRISRQLKQAVGSENPFLSKATLEKIRENRAWTPDNDNASVELHKLLKNNPLQKMSFDASTSSKEYQALRSKASQLINDIIRTNLPRLEAELRMKLEQEVDLMFKTAQKKSRK